MPLIIAIIFIIQCVFLVSSLKQLHINYALCSQESLLRPKKNRKCIDRAVEKGLSEVKY